MASLISRLEKLEHDCIDMLDRVRELLASHGSNVSERMGAMEQKLTALFEAIGISPPEPSPPSEPDTASVPKPTAAEIASYPSWFNGEPTPVVPEPDNSNPEASAPAA